MPVVTGILDRVVSEVINPAAMVVFAAGFLLFLWGLVKFLWNLEEGSENDEGKQHMLWGVFGMFVMVSIWGILGLLTNTFGLGDPANLKNGPAVDPARNQIRLP